MKQSKKAFVASLVAITSILLAGCGKKSEDTITVTGDYLTGKTAKKVYNAYLGSAPTTLDATKSQSAENVTHLANFTDCLVMNDQYGILRKALATKVTKSSDNRVYTFELRTDVPWVTNEGKIYQYKNVDQYVKANDFVNTAKLILDFENNSEIYYMYTLFISNAWEYYCYTMMNSYIKNSSKIGGVDYSTLKGDEDAQAVQLAKLIKEYSGFDPEQEITSTDIKDIRDFKRVGVKAEGDNKIVYTLKERADFFPTVLTYTPFTPINENFYKANKATYGTTNPTKILYCGPYILKELTATSMKYEANPYWNDLGQAHRKVHIDKVNYSIVSASVGYPEMREAFEKGEVDGFSLNKKDTVGWEQYITGPQNTGTVQNPYSAIVNSRELDDVSYTYHFVLNQNRSTEKASYENSTIYDGMTDDQIKAEIENTNKALKIRELRKLVLDGIDLANFNERHNAPENRDQYQMNTFTPRGYVFDEFNKDYVDNYYETYARNKGLVASGATESEAVAKGKEFVGPQQINGTNVVSGSDYAWLNLETTRNNAMKAVDAYNNTIATTDAEKIKLPVIIEYNSVAALDADSAQYENQTYVLWNERANGCTISSAKAKDGKIPLCPNGADGKPAYPYFQMKATSISSSTKFTNVTNNGYYTLYTGWGWVGDYADPLTYLHCYVTNGEMSKMSGNKAEFDNYRYDAETDTISKDAEHMFAHYNEAVEAASNINESNSLRFKAFAACEYELLNDIYIIKPSYMSTQGYAVSVSRAAGYENPSAHYGLADNMLSGLWCLVDVPTGEERASARALQATKKEEALAAVGHNTINPIYAD